MAITGVSYRRVNGTIEPIDILKEGKAMAARSTKLSTRKEEPTETRITYKDGVVSAEKTSRILTEDDVARIIHPDTSEKEIFDNVSNPAHYTGGRKYEPRKVIMDWELNFYTGNAVKYISRAGRKGSAVEDLRKAIQYLEWEIERLEEKEEN